MKNLRFFVNSCPSGNGLSYKVKKNWPSGKIELEFFTQKREAADTFDKIIAEFNASQDEIVVTQNIVPDSTSVLMSRAATGDLPDIIQVGGMQDSNTMQFMKEGHFLDFFLLSLFFPPCSSHLINKL